MTSLDTLSSDELYEAPPTFMGIPFRTDATGAGAAILGCPFDCGTHKFRIGARQGPAAIRAQSGLLRRYQSEIADCDALTELGVIDAGDVLLVPSRAQEAFPLIEEAAYRIAVTGAVPVGFGGDGSVSLPLVRAAAKVHPGLAVLHIDSHTDAYPIDPVHQYDAASQFTHAALEQRILTSASWHVGLRGSTVRPGVYDHTRELGYNIMSMTELQNRGLQDAVKELRQTLAQRPVYLSWDMDVFDPSCAPGVCTPVWGGLSSREGIDLLRMLEGLNIVGADVNTVSPPHDINGMTAFLAAAVTYEILLLIWRRQADART
ncbi:arginase family protein [Nitratireductor soli]|uniref:arginase family protein n=1 Tax=Nitratireductor soli TaxID=1670619 RepID=UPI00069EB5CF|nr:arginase family protein [Nitratireductor soli]